MDLSGHNLRGRSFKGQNLEGANFSGADIRNADFTGANLRNANFSHAQAGLQMKGDEKYAIIRNIAVDFAAFGGTSFRNANLTDANFTAATLKSTDFRKANLTRTCFNKTKMLDRVRTGKTYLQNAQVVSVLVMGQGQEKNFDRKDLRGVNFQGANLVNASFIGADLSKANLRNADLSRAKLVQAQLDGTDFTGATLTGAYIQDWGITTDTKFDGVRCKYVLRPPTKENPDPLRKPDNNIATYLIKQKKRVFLGLLLMGVILPNPNIFREFNYQNEYHPPEIKGGQREAKSYITVINRAEQAFYQDRQNDKSFLLMPSELEKNNFTSRLEDLDPGFRSETTYYHYSILRADNLQAIVTAAAKKHGFKSYIGAVFLVKNADGSYATLTISCETNTPSKTPPVTPKISGNDIQCPSDSQPSSTFSPG